MTTDFSHLDLLQVNKENTAEYEIYEIETAPTLIVRCTADNNEYQAKIRGMREQITRKLNSKKKQQRKRSRITDQIFDLLRNPDREAYPGMVVVGWTTNKDANGEEVEYSDEACTDFLKALPDWLFDGIRMFCIDAQNFIKVQMSADDEEEISGN